MKNKFDKLPAPKEDKTGWPWKITFEPIPETTPGGSSWPKISVVTPSLNQGQFIEETIRSVLLQGYPNLEFIIIDGGSTDNTLEIIRKYAPWLAHWVSEPDRGQSHAVNKGIQQATGDIIHWLNSDDILLPGALHVVAKEFIKNPTVKLVVGQAYVIDVYGKVIGELKSSFSTWEDLVTTPNNKIRQVASFFASEILFDHYLLNENLLIAMDTELLIKITKLHTPTIITKYLAAFRSQPESKTTHLLLMGYKETDESRLKTITNRDLRARYRLNSASNWVDLSRMARYSPKERLGCLIQAVNINPKVIITMAYWSAVKKNLQRNW